MKLVINYDFFNAIKNVNEPTGPLKLIRNNKYRYMIYAPIWYAQDVLLGRNFNENIAIVLMCYGLAISCELGILYSSKKINSNNMDKYAYESSNKLKRLSSQLKDINVKTDYDMLLKSELYDKKYKIEFNEDKIPFLKEEKYILMPSYGFDGQQKETSIMQEHNIGSSNYILSVGEPEKQYKKVLVKSYI